MAASKKNSTGSLEMGHTVCERLDCLFFFTHVFLFHNAGSVYRTGG